MEEHPALSAPNHAALPRRRRGPSRGRGAVMRRELRSDGRRTKRRLLEAGRIALGEHGFHALRVDDVVHRAGTSHGTFYLYFSSKEDMVAMLVHDALREMEAVVDTFPDVVSRGDDGRAALRSWVRRFCATYAAHARPLQLLTHADTADQDLRSSGLRLLWRLAEAITHGMTAADGPAMRSGEHTEFTALACAMMLERMTYLLSAGVTMPKGEVPETVAAIVAAAFSSG